MLHTLTMWINRLWLFWMETTPLIVMDRTNWINATLAVVILILLFVLFYLWHRKETNQKKLSEKLRDKIARDLHDEMGSNLSVISMYSELAKSQVKEGKREVISHLEKITEASGNLYDSMKDLVWTLDPGKDSLQDLLVKIKEFGEDLFSATSISFEAGRAEEQWNDIILPMDYKRHILLIFKEAMNNAFKHANGSKVSLQVTIEQQSLRIVLSDDGQGFNPGKRFKGEGLANMESRAKKINARMLVRSSNGGTTIKLSCPLPL